MEVYLVGGAVRDELLGLPVIEKDWCVVGETPDTLLRLGYRAVGSDFPVFLHPESGEEYALARTERKTAAGYHGFSFHAAPDVTLEDDLRRRDLTINAMARDSDGALIDPFDGATDIGDKVLRHVSTAFTEDPVRILRTARFAARFHHLGFRVAGETMQLMSDMVAAGEASALAPERVWKEAEKALAGANPQVFFTTMNACNALEIVFPEIHALFGVPQPEKWHPEIDCGVHTMMALEQAAILSTDIAVRFAALVHDLGKATTRQEDLPKHPGHEIRSAGIVKSLCKRMPVPNACRDLGLLAAEFHAHCHRAFELRPDTLLKVFERTDAFRRPGRFDRFLLACEADARGRTGLESAPYPQAGYLRNAHTAASEIDTDDLQASDMKGAAIGKEIRARRIRALTDFKKTQDPPKK